MPLSCVTTLRVAGLGTCVRIVLVVQILLVAILMVAKTVTTMMRKKTRKARCVVPCHPFPCFKNPPGTETAAKGSKRKKT